MNMLGTVNEATQGKGEVAYLSVCQTYGMVSAGAEDVGVQTHRLLKVQPGQCRVRSTVLDALLVLIL